MRKVKVTRWDSPGPVNREKTDSSGLLLRGRIPDRPLRPLQASRNRLSDLPGRKVPLTIALESLP